MTLLFTSLLSAAMLTLPMPTEAAQVAADWSAVVQLTPGVDVRVDERAGERTDGELIRVDLREIVVRETREHKVLPRGDVLSVGVRRRSPLLGAKRGFLVGATAGGLLAVFALEGSRLAFGSVLVLGWGGIGAAIGAVSAGYHYDPIYVSSR